MTTTDSPVKSPESPVYTLGDLIRENMRESSLENQRPKEVNMSQKKTEPQSTENNVSPEMKCTWRQKASAFLLTALVLILAFGLFTGSQSASAEDTEIVLDTSTADATDAVEEEVLPPDEDKAGFLKRAGRAYDIMFGQEDQAIVNIDEREKQLEEASLALVERGKQLDQYGLRLNDIRNHLNQTARDLSKQVTNFVTNMNKSTNALDAGLTASVNALQSVSDDLSETPDAVVPVETK